MTSKRDFNHMFCSSFLLLMLRLASAFNDVFISDLTQLPKSTHRTQLHQSALVLALSKSDSFYSSYLNSHH